MSQGASYKIFYSIMDNFPMEKNFKYKFPGPGQLNYFKLKDWSIQSLKILTLWIFKQRFNCFSNDHYKPSGQITPDGYYFPSKFNSSRCRTFSRQKREY